MGQLPLAGILTQERPGTIGNFAEFCTKKAAMIGGLLANSGRAGGYGIN
jgi:hypothetical protein